MALDSLASYFDPLLIHRLLYRENVARATNALKLLFGLIILLALIYTFSVAITGLLTTPGQIDQLEQQLSTALEQGSVFSTPEDSSIDFDALADSNMFGSVSTGASSATKVKPTKPKSNVPLELIGTFVSGGGSQAIIEEKKKKVQEVFSVGDSVFGEAKLVKILSNQVEIDRDGKTEILVIDESLGSGAGGQTKESNDEEFVIDETELGSALDNLPLLLTQARAVPYFKEGKAIGLRLFAIKSGSLYQKIGLKNGDILKEINGDSLADMSQAMKLFERLREERSLRLKLERNKKEHTFFYTIQ